MYDDRGLNLWTGQTKPLQELATLSTYNLDFLPGLKTIQILMLISKWGVPPDAEKCQAAVQRHLDVLLAGRDVTVPCEQPNMKADDYFAL